MSNRNPLLGRSKPSEKLTREELAALDKVTAPPVPLVPPRAADESTGEAAGAEGRWYAAEGTQGPAEVSLEHRVP